MTPHWQDHDPHADQAVYVPLEELAECCAGGTVRLSDGTEADNSRELVLEGWRSLGDKVDGYILPDEDGFHSVVLRFGGEECDYIEEDVRNPGRVLELLGRYPIKADFGTIRFPGNPWPNGHRIDEFVWSGHISESGLVFDLHLRTERYYADDPEDEPDEAEGLGDWQSKRCWGNYHRCILSSTYWNERGRGVTVGTCAYPFDVDALSREPLCLEGYPDQMGYEYDELAFQIYLLGHDAVADHTIRFHPPDASGKRAISWSGRIALIYSGVETYEHEFAAEILPTDFRGFSIPEGMDATKAWKLLRDFVTDTGRYRLVAREGGRAFVWC